MTESRLTQPPIAKKGMLVRRPLADVFQAFVDPAITTKFWFTNSTGKLVRGARVRWTWEMYGASTDVVVKELEDGARVVFAWGHADRPTTVELRFVPWQGHTFVQISESGFTGTADEIVAHAIDSTGGFALVLAAAKALLEHDVLLTVVLDHMPKGIQV
jgi:uncharacterized protein YndB with AHSA1/START domain